MPYFLQDKKPIDWGNEVAMKHTPAIRREVQVHVSRLCGWGALYGSEIRVSKQKMQKLSDGSSEEFLKPNCEAK